MIPFPESARQLVVSTGVRGKNSVMSISLKNGASAEDLALYDVVRSTIQGLDNLILNLMLQGSVFVMAFLGVAGFVYTNIQDCVAGWNVGRLGAGLVCVMAGLLDVALMRQLKLYMEFLGEAVTIGKDLEVKCIVPEYQITHRFERQKYAGMRGKRLFPWVLRAMLALSIIALVFVASSVRKVPLSTMGRAHSGSLTAVVTDNNGTAIAAFGGSSTIRNSTVSNNTGNRPSAAGGIDSRFGAIEINDGI